MVSFNAAGVRTTIARLLWLVFLLCAVVLAIGALLVALDANRGNDLVQFVLDSADAVDLGVFDRRDGVFTFHGNNGETLNALVNWGLAAVVWLVLGRIVERLIRP